MKIAITGGAGFIGSHLTKAYLDAGHDVLVIDTLLHSSRKAVDPRARFYSMDIRDSKLHSLLQRERPDIVSHHALQRTQDTLPLAAMSVTDADTHIRGLLNVLDACVSASVSKIIFASGGSGLYGRVSSADIAETGIPVVQESTALCPKAPHDISKVAGEWYVRYYTGQYSLTHTILRYADVYGETDSTSAHHPLTYFVRMLQEGQRPIIRGAVDEVRDHIFIDDVVTANMAALERGQNSTLHISSGQGYTLNQLYQTVAYLLFSEIEPVYISNSLVEANSCILDNALARRVLKWEPQIELTIGVQRAIERLQGQMKQDTLIGTQLLESCLVGVR
jgi:UDP-glucose 4-epimerase